MFLEALNGAQRILLRELAQPRLASLGGLGSAVNVAEACRRYGLGEVLVETGAGQHGGLREVAGRRHAVLYRRGLGPDWLTARERFSVAHELAHAIVDDLAPVRLNRPSHYWQLEAVCDDFAARLLVSDAVLRETLREKLAQPTAQGLLDAVRRTAREQQVSMSCAARRIVELRPGTAVWAFDSPVGGRVLVSFAHSNDLALGATARSKLPVEHPAVTADHSRPLKLDGRAEPLQVAVASRLGRFVKATVLAAPASHQEGSHRERFQQPALPFA